MRRTLARRIFALLLGLSFALGSSITVVQATDMATTMSAAADAEAAQLDFCDVDCDNTGLGSGTCFMVCPNALQAHIPDSGLVFLLGTFEILPGDSNSLNGQYLVVDPHPPKDVFAI